MADEIIKLIDRVEEIRETLEGLGEADGSPDSTSDKIFDVQAREEEFQNYRALREELIDTSRHVVIESPHPSPLSAHRGFFGSRPFSRANAALVEAGREPVDWSLDVPVLGA